MRLAGSLKETRTVSPKRCKYYRRFVTKKSRSQGVLALKSRRHPENWRQSNPAEVVDGRHGRLAQIFQNLSSKDNYHRFF